MFYPRLFRSTFGKPFFHNFSSNIAAIFLVWDHVETILRLFQDSKVLHVRRVLSPAGSTELAAQRDAE